VTVALLNAFTRPFLDGRLPDWVEPRWFDSAESFSEFLPEAEIGWFDSFGIMPLGEAVQRADRLKWLNTLSAGVDFFPLDLLRQRGVLFTNGAGLNSITIAEYAVMGMLVIAKGYREVVHSQDRHEWMKDAPGKIELFGSKLLIIGGGGIGGRVVELLGPWGVEIATVRRNPAPSVLTPSEWRARLAEFDWVLVAVPSTPDTERMFGTAEFAAMKEGASILNFARGAVIDQDALMAALDEGRLGGAFLDVTSPEPLPPDHRLWTYDNVHITSHLSGRSQETLILRSAERFLENLGRCERGEPLEARVDLSLGY
jgi:phosphoglycerate dehydrogenase-like enzyme